MLARMLNELAAWKRVRAIAQELRALSDRELDDLGIARSQIFSIAKSGALA